MKHLRRTIGRLHFPDCGRRLDEVARILASGSDFGSSHQCHVLTLCDVLRLASRDVGQWNSVRVRRDRSILRTE